MIERYSITSSPLTLKERFGVEVPAYYAPSYNAAPTKLLPVITNTSPNGISTFYWGETPGWAKNKTPGEKLINVRIESLSEKLSLRKALAKTRCIIPADSFYGWKKVGKKTSIPYRFVTTSNSIFSFPGLWEEYEDVEGKEMMHTFTIFTTAANELVSTVQDRMPVIFDRSAELAWLSKDASESELFELLQHNLPLTLNYYPVSPRINDPNIDVPSLITPTPPSDQFGNLTLFD